MRAAQAVKKAHRMRTGQPRAKVQALRKPVRHANDDNESEEVHLPFSAQVSCKSKISGKGQITLPALVRNRLGVKLGDQVEFFFDGERTVVKPVRSEQNPFEKWIGVARDVPADFDVNEWISDMRDDAQRRADLKEGRVANRG